MFQIQYLDIIEVYNDAEMRFLCNDECGYNYDEILKFFYVETDLREMKKEEK